jgi:F-type H+-transporting ATPase subunit delta
VKAEESIPVTYARALLEAAVHQGVLDDVMEEVSFFARLLDENRDLRIFIENPRVERSAKQSALDGSLRSRMSDTFVNFLLLLVRKGRQVYLLDALGEFEALYDEKVGRVRAVAISAVSLAEETLADVHAALAARTGKQILLTNKVDPSILAGLVLRYAGMVADGSLKTALDDIRSSTVSVKLGSQLIHED